LVSSFLFLPPRKSLPSCDLSKLQVLTHSSNYVEHTNHPSYTPMERIIQQVTVVRQYLTEENGKVIVVFQYFYSYI